MAIEDADKDAEARQIEETERSERIWRLTIYMMGRRCSDSWFCVLGSTALVAPQYALTADLRNMFQDSGFWWYFRRRSRMAHEFKQVKTTLSAGR